MPISDDQLILKPNGRIYHLALCPGELAETIILVGDPGRVAKISRYFDHIELQRENREIITHTGTYQGKRLSVMSTGMGIGCIDIVMTEIDALFNVDFVTRDIKSTPTSLNLVRLGTCGGLQSNIEPGSFVASKSAIGFDGLMHCYQRDYSEHEIALTNAITMHCADFAGGKLLPYVCDGSDELLALFQPHCHVGITATCAGFYGPQGRQIRLPAKNPDLLDQMQSFSYQEEKILNFEMETSGIYGLGQALGHHCLSLSAVLVNRLKQSVDDPAKAIDDLIRLTLEILSKQ